MSILIGHAVMDENGGIDGAMMGDQTGKEITTRKWYKRTGGWNAYLQPLDLSMAENAATYMRLICDNAAYGYSQPNRWTGYKAIQALVKKGASVTDAIAQSNGDFDCSSLVISCYIFAGLDHAASGYTGSIAKSFKATGKFKLLAEDKYIGSDTYAQRGGVYVGKGHTLMCLENGSGHEEPVTGAYVLVKGGSVHVREGAGTEYPKLYTAHAGDKLPYQEIDEDTGWYWVDTPHGIGCISGKKNLTVLIT